MNSTLLNITLVLAAFMMMEGVAHLSHKYVMHGFLWSLHKFHHEPRKGLFDLNDLFVFYFALPSILFIWVGVYLAEPFLYIGLGMTAYGIMYFIFHDGIVHHRMGFHYRAANPYMRRIIQAHGAHHAWNGRDGAVSFGFLYSRPIKDYRDELRSLHGWSAHGDGESAGAKMSLTDEQKLNFSQRGFIVLKGFIDLEVIGRVSDWLDELQAGTKASGHAAKYYEKSPITGEDILVRVEHVLGDHDSEITELLLGEKTQDCLEQLLGEAPLLFKEKINFKYPGCRADKLHQDQAAGWNRYANFFITMCIAIDPNREENAALRFMHTGNYQKSLMSDEWVPLSGSSGVDWADDEYVMLEADPGDVIFFDCYVPHGSPPNVGSHGRRNVYLTFNRESDGDLRASYYEDKWQAYPPNDVEHSRSADSFRV
jgi:ectoine hydroxylase-related dioxygenase (phytanoyl-CoA dioxygenase family)